MKKQLILSFAFGLGLTAAWGAMIAHNMLLCALFALHYRRGRWNPLRQGKREA